jgi:hypothetical protein
MNWLDLVPERIAKMQERWEKRVKAIRMRECGFLLKEIGAVTGTTHQNASQQSKRYQTVNRMYLESSYLHDRLLEMSPIEHYLANDADVRRLKGGRCPLTRTVLMSLAHEVVVK